MQEIGNTFVGRSPVVSSRVVLQQHPSRFSYSVIYGVDISYAETGIVGVCPFVP